MLAKCKKHFAIRKKKINFAAQKISVISGSRNLNCEYYVLYNILIINEMDLIKVAEQAFNAESEKKEFPKFKSGDTVAVAYRIKEGNKERVQEFRGDVIRISGHQDKKRFTVRKMSGNVGVERIFPMDSPFIENISIVKYGKVRRAKLYYLRKLTGKRARIKERRV